MQLPLYLHGWPCALAVATILLAGDSLFLHAAEPGKISTVAGSGKGELGAHSGPALEVNINQPFGVDFGPDGHLYITEVGHHRVMRLDLEKGTVATVAGSGVKGYSGDGGPAVEAKLNEPYEVRFDPQGNMYFVEMVGAVIRKVDAKTGVISTVAGTGKPGFGGDPAAKAQFKQPHSIALDDQNKLYVADIGNHRIRRIDLKTGLVDTLIGDGQAKLPTTGPIAGQSMREPRALHIVGRTMWIALRSGHSIWRLDLDKETLSHVAGTGKSGYSGDGGPAVAATFNGPKGIVAGPHNDVFVVDTENQVVRRIDLSTGLISTVAGVGPKGRGFSGDGGPAPSGKMDRPHGMTVDPSGVLYIGDTNNHRVRRVGP